jgi:hypothetical protein
MTWKEAAPVRAFVEDAKVASKTVTATWDHHSSEIEK